MRVLEGLFYTREHEWVKVEGERAIIGITDFAQKALGDIVFIELPEVDSELSVGDTLATIESVKAASDAYMPIEGKVVEANEAIVDDPSLVNQDPYANWMVAVEMTDSTQLDNLMNPLDYEEFCSKEE